MKQMNKITVKFLFAMLLAVFLLFSTFAVSEDATFMVMPVRVADYATDRNYADELEQRFGITILFGSDCLGVIESDSYSIGVSGPLAGITLGEILGYSYYETQLEVLEKALDQYPTELFSRLMDDRAPNGIRILIVDELKAVNSERSVDGFYMCKDGYDNIILERSGLRDLCVHHELWHNMENFIKARKPDAFMIWDALNPPGFKYCDDFENYSGKVYDAEYFVRDYGLINAAEDRATVVEAAFYANRAEWFAEHPAVRQKLYAINLVLKDMLGIEFSAGNISIPQEVCVDK